MNDPSKKIDVNLSSLMSLKAELLRKQAEVSKVKATRSTEPMVPNKSKTYLKDTVTVTPKTKQDENFSTKTFELEDSSLLEKSRKVLEAKSKYYDRMTAMGGQLNSDDNCLVQFNRKKQEDPQPRRLSNASSSSSNYSDSEDEHLNAQPIGPDEEWVEYTDCLGRTRKCMRGDLETIKKKDTELAASIPERLDQSRPNWMIDVVGSKKENLQTDPAGSVIGDSMSVMSKHDEMRNNWEKKEIENVTKENVHYQDVFFDEARQHGVGYYAFSTDEEERARQQKELEDARKKTIDEQANKEAQRNYREKVIAERVRAAKNRQRARLGLPPLEDVEQENDNKKTSPKETKEEKRKRKKEEKRKRRLEKEEELREQERQSHVRPWDKQKINSKSSDESTEEPSVEQPWAYRPDRNPMSQEEWNEKKRAERNPEFAPTFETAHKEHKKSKFRRSEDEPSSNMARTNFKADTAIFHEPLPPSHHNPFASADVDSFSSFQTTKRVNNFRKRNYDALVVDEKDNQEMSKSRRGVEIPPPNCFDPEVNVRSRQPASNLESSIEAGLKFLRNNFDKNTLCKKSSWTAKSDY